MNLSPKRVDVCPEEWRMANGMMIVLCVPTLVVSGLGSFSHLSL